MAQTSKTVLIFAEGSGGDVYPCIGIGKAMAERGHKVRLISNSYFESAATQAGLEFISSGSAEEARKTAEDPDTWKRGTGIRQLFTRAAATIPETYKLIRQLYVPGETVVVSTFLVFGARVAQEHLGLPLATVHPETVLLRSRSAQPGMNVPDSLLSVLRPFREAFLAILDRRFFDPLVAPQLNAFRGELGLPPVSRVLDRWIHSPQLVIGLYPDWFLKPQQDWPPNTHLVGFPMEDLKGEVECPPAVELFLRAGEPPLVFTLGSAIPMTQMFIDTCFQICQSLGRRGLFLSPFPERFPAVLPPGIAVFRFVPFSSVLPRSAALIHHGGIGTMAQAFAAGIPQLAIPHSFDQPANAALLRALGAGSSLRPRAFKAGLASRKLTRLLASPQVAAACRRCASLMKRSAATSEACLLIERLAEMPRGQAATARI